MVSEQVGRHKLQPQRWEEPLSQRPLAGQRRRQLGGQPLDPAAALAAAQALLADLGGPKVALAEPAAPKPLQLTGTWDKACAFLRDTFLQSWACCTIRQHLNKQREVRLPFCSDPGQLTC